MSDSIHGSTDLGGGEPQSPASVAIPAGGVVIEGDLTVPRTPTGVVLFAHGSWSGRHSSRNRFVAAQLQASGLATLLIDLLTPQEESVDLRTGHLRFDIDLLAERLGSAVHWLGADMRTSGLPIGIFGASTGGGAALVAAARHPERVAAVVSRGGRPDLAGEWLEAVTAPTLLIVGANDVPVIRMNREAMQRMTGLVELEIVPGATHLFEEPGTLEEVARLARDWFSRHLRG